MSCRAADPWPFHAYGAGRMTPLAVKIPNAIALPYHISEKDTDSKFGSGGEGGIRTPAFLQVTDFKAA